MSNDERMANFEAPVSDAVEFHRNALQLFGRWFFVILGTSLPCSKDFSFPKYLHAGIPVERSGCGR